MANEGNRNSNRIRRMDLNLYLGLPRRLPESDLGSDLALGSPIFPEMSTSQTESNPSVSQSTHNQVVDVDDIRSNDLEYNPYSPYYDPVLLPDEQTSLEEQTLGDNSNNNINNNNNNNNVFYDRFVQTPPTVQDSTEAIVHEGSNSNDVEYVPYSVSSYAPVSLSPPSHVNEQQSAQGENPHVPYIPTSVTNQTQNDHLTGESVPEAVGFGPYRADRPRGRPLVRDSSMQRVLFQYPEVRFQRLIDLNLRWRQGRRLRSSLSYEAVADPEFVEDLPDVGGAFRDATVSETSPEINCGNQKASVENQDSLGVKEKEPEDQKSGAANFDCNVCLDMAKEPVVTSCGHLFCWPCLYQWLHVHSDHKECPICKGEVTESNVTPIYGRGSSETGLEKKGGEEENSSLKIPPRPHGRRLESFRQQLSRPTFGSWTLVRREDMHNYAEGQEEPSAFTAPNGRLLARVRASHRSQRDNNVEHATNIGGSGSSRTTNGMNLNQDGNGSTDPERHQSALSRRAIGVWSAFIGTPERLASLAADFSSVVGGRGTATNSSNRAGASASVAVNQDSDPPNVGGNREPVVSADQASASSTIATIQGDTSGRFDAPAEPSSVGSSSTLRRRRRNNFVPRSLDVDGGIHPPSKRRRLN